MAKTYRKLDRTKPRRVPEAYAKKSHSHTSKRTYDRGEDKDNLNSSVREAIEALDIDGSLSRHG